MGQREKTIREYRAALALEDNPHTHKLLGIELADAGQWTDALFEFRAADRGGEPDDSLSFRIGQALDASGQPLAAVHEYRRFLESHRCTQPLPDDRCGIAGRRAMVPPTNPRR
jgi:tetratricopeptide (TPR) repeat protein